MTFKVGFVGMSHLGINCLAATSEKNFSVIGFDFEKDKIEKLNKYKSEIFEPKLNSILKKNKKKICFTDQINKLKNCKLIYYVYDTETDSKNVPNYFIQKIRINKILSKLNKNNIFIIKSQVFPGFSETFDIKKNKIYYEVETLIFGKAINQAIHPSRIIVGSKNIKIDKKYLYFLKKFTKNIILTNFKTAELTKIFINLFLISNISLTNILNKICNSLGAQWNTISSALKLDNRIGKHAYIQPGLGISGGNLERDLEAIINLSKKYKLDTKLFTLYKKNSLDFKNWPFETYLKYFDKKKITKIFILGLSYKKNTNSTKNSPSLILINKLKKYNKNLQIHVYDPIIKNFKSSLFNLEKTINLKNKYDIIFIMHDCDEFKNLSINKLDKILNKKNLIDPFGVFFRHKEKIKNYLSLC